MKGVLLVNLGSPESPDAKDVKPYLDEFLMDKYVIDVPFLLRALLVRGIILRKRPEKSAEAYKKTVKLDPSHPNRFYNLALALQGEKHWTQAVEALDSALELDPKNKKYADLRFELESKSKTKVPVENISKTV